MAAAGWSELPWDLLNKIVSLFGIPHDFARFKSVCSSWRLFAAAHIEQVSSTSTPRFLGLMLPGDRINRRDFYSPLDSKVYRNLVRFPVDHCCRGTRDGWLINVSFSTKKVWIVHPLSGDRLQMVRFPSLTSLEDKDWNPLQSRFTVLRAILSSNPSSQTALGGLTMVVIFGLLNRLAYARAGAETWVLVQDVDRINPFHDIVYYRDGFYAVNQMGTIFSIHIDCSCVPSSRVVMPASSRNRKFHRFYLVESHDGELLILVSKSRINGIVTFGVYQLDLKNQRKIEMGDLGDASLLLGRNNTTSLSIPFPENFGLRKNCIYFTSYDIEKKSSVVSLFDLGTEKIERSYSHDNMFKGAGAGAPYYMWLAN